MTLPTRTPDQFVSDMTAAFAAQAGVQPVFSSGDPLLAFLQTVSVQLDFLQALAQQIVNLTRAQTSTGSDLDAWMAQFNFARLAATSATTQETFSANQPAAAPVNIQAAALNSSGVYAGGVIVQSSNGGTQYQVVPDTGNPAYSATLNAYVLTAGQSSVTATVQALNAGSASNVAAATLIQIGTPLPGIDSATNASPASNGLDAESDSAFRARFVTYLASLAQATRSAILTAIASVQQGLLVTLVENASPTSPACTATATIGGTTLNSGDVVSLTFTNAAVSDFPVTVSYTLGASETTTTVAAGLTSAINANTTLAAAHVTATSAGAVVTVSQVGSVGNSTLLTAAVTGTGNETVTFDPATGLLSGGGLTGCFTAYVDDGSGDPPGSLLASVFNAVNGARAFGIEAFVSGPVTTLPLAIAITIRVASGYTAATVESAVQNAIAAAVNAMAAGATVFVSSVVEAAALSVAGCQAVRPGTTINGVAADYTPAATVEPRTTISNISTGTY